MAMEPIPLGFGGDGLDAALFSSLWSLQEEMQMLPPESVEELKQSLVAARVELEAAREELRKKEQSIAKLAGLVRQVAKERDDARDQVQQLLLAVAAPKHQQQQEQQAAAHAAAASAAAGMVTSSVTDSDGSLVSSPVDPFFDPVTSSDRRCGAKLASPPHPAPAATAHHPQPPPPQQQCPADAVLDMLARKKPLPARGRMLQSVMEAGPLLHNLLVAGPLPRWRNPPPLHPLDTLPVGGGGGGCYVGTLPPPLPTTTLGGYVLPSAANNAGCMKRPVPMAATTANCSPGYAAKRHRMH